MSELMHNGNFIRAIGLLAHSAFFCIVFVIASQISPAALLRELRRPKLLIRTFVITSLVVPLLTAGIVKVLHVPMLLGGVMLLGAVTPGSPFALMGTKSKKGSLPLASVIMGFLIVIMPVMVPGWLWIFSHWFGLHHLEISPFRIFVTVVNLTLTPLVIGVVLNVLLPRVTDGLRRVLALYSKVAILIILVLFIVPGVKTLTTFSLVDWVAIVVVMTLALIAGYYSGGSTRPERISIALASTECNLTALMVIARVSYPQIHILDVLLAYVLVSWLTAMVWYVLFRRQLSRSASDAFAER
ncbi:MAG: bile acid:sodium symporter [Kiritimatiellae bacterium]|nr:bile acid:sodium symporter [Kiritimatiellia bacterium]